jgi:hypothetical protein
MSDSNGSHPKRLSQSQKMQLGYRFRRYLSGSSDQELVQRLHDIAVNLYTFTSDGKIGVLQNDRRDYWLEKLEHLIVENGVRDRDPLKDSDLKDWVFTKNTLEKLRSQPDALKMVSVPGYFYRFGRRQNMQALMENGQMYLQPASYYSSRALDLARRDDELNFRTHVCPHDYDLNVLDPVIRKLLPQRCYKYIDQRKPSDYYLFCLGVSFEVRLFADFKAQACLIIRDQPEFERRLTKAVSRELPGWLVKFDAARYVDPYNMPSRLPGEATDMPFYKHHSYMYQSEFRLVALPPNGNHLPAKLLEIGGLADISELVVLNGDPFCH